MSDHPPIKNGTRVKVTVRTVRRTGNGDYTAEAITARTLHDGKIGIACEHHDSHGLCYGVEFEGGLAFFNPKDPAFRYPTEFKGAVAFFDPEELELLDKRDS